LNQRFKPCTELTANPEPLASCKFQGAIIAARERARDRNEITTGSPDCLRGFFITVNKPSFKPASNRRLYPILATINLANQKRTSLSIPPRGLGAAPLGFEHASRGVFLS
jgi:hypothetical protein